MKVLLLFTLITSAFAEPGHSPSSTHSTVISSGCAPLLNRAPRVQQGPELSPVERSRALLNLYLAMSIVSFYQKVRNANGHGNVSWEDYRVSTAHDRAILAQELYDKLLNRNPDRVLHPTIVALEKVFVEIFERSFTKIEESGTDLELRERIKALAEADGSPEINPAQIFAERPNWYRLAETRRDIVNRMNESFPNAVRYLGGETGLSARVNLQGDALITYLGSFAFLINEPISRL